MGRARRWSAVAGLGVLTLAAGALAVNVAVVSGSGAQVRPQQTTETTYPPGPQGTNYTIHTSADTNFCLSYVAADDREMSLQACADNDTQHWTWAQSADNSSVLVDGGGQCLQAAAKSGKQAEVDPCAFLATEHFLFKGAGQIQTVSGNLCLEDAQPTADSAVFFATCVKGLASQVGDLGH
jgi:hypothetical protein